MWGLILKHKESIVFRIKERGQLISKIEHHLKENNFKNIKVSDYLITAEKSTPFKYHFFGSLSARTYYIISLTEDGKLSVECSVTKGPGTDWGYCKKEVTSVLVLINS